MGHAYQDYLERTVDSHSLRIRVLESVIADAFHPARRHSWEKRAREAVPNIDEILATLDNYEDPK